MPQPVNELVMGTSEVRLAARRLRWFSTSFRRQVEIVSRDTGIEFDLNERQLAAAFVSWLRQFEMVRASADLDRRDFTHFAAGTMLRQLISHAPLEATLPPQDKDPADPASYWPEGYTYLTYCMAVCEAVLQQEFGAHIEPDPELGDISVWWSFRENMREDVRWAIPFFDKFVGHEANWAAPGLFFSRRAIQEGLRRHWADASPGSGNVATQIGMCHPLTMPACRTSE